MSTTGKNWSVEKRRKYSHIITRDILVQATVDCKSDQKLADELKVPVGAVHTVRKQLGIKSGRSDESVGKIRLQKMDPALVGCIVGTVLGDGFLGLNKQKNLAYLAISHGYKQKEWIEYKYKKLSDFVIMNLRYGERPRYKNIEETLKFYVFTTVFHPDLFEIRKLLYDENGKKKVTKEALDLLTYEGFIWWFFDDGCANIKYNKVTGEIGQQYYSLATCQFSLEEQKLIRSMLFKKFGIKTTIIKVTPKTNNKKPYYTLYFAVETRDKVSEILSKISLESMNYKIIKPNPDRRFNKIKIKLV
jgi:hypothetical protein